MTHNQTAFEDMVSQLELQSLAAATGPCITATVSIPVPAQIRPRINHTVRELERRLKETDIEARAAGKLMEPLHELSETIGQDGDWAITLVLCRSADTFRCFRLPEPTKDVISIGQGFYLRPLLAAVSREQRFHLLALSQKSVRLFNCGLYRIQEIDLAGRVPQNLDGFLNTKMPDHVLDNRSSGGSSVGSMKGVTFGTSTDREKRDKYVAHFFGAIDKGIHKILAANPAPLMLAGVEEELALYRRISTYKDFTENDVHGSPDGVPLNELFQHARAIVRKSPSTAVAKVIREFDQYRSARRVATDIHEIVVQAREGRVSDLLIREDAERRVMQAGATQEMDAASGEDLLNRAAIETLAHKGQAFSLTASEIPGQVEVAAVLRY